MSLKQRTLLDDSKEIGLEINKRKKKQVCVHVSSSEQNHNIDTDNKSFRNMWEQWVMGK
jgi:hypothetical protein